MVRLENVSKVYPGRDFAALNRIALAVAKGRFVFLTGPSGAGKTTLLRLLFGAQYPTSGRVLIGGWDLGSISPSKLPRLRRRLGVVFQDFKLLDQISVYENVALALRVRGQAGAALDKRVRQVLDQVGLGDKLSLPVDALSGGEQQRVAIARALVGRPPLILADEPTGNLDPENAKEVMALLAQAHKGGSTVIVATHDPSLFDLVPDAGVLRLDHGRLEAGS